MQAKRVRSLAAVVGFIVLCVGVGLVSVPWSLITAGGVLLAAAVAGEIREQNNA